MGSNYSTNKRFYQPLSLLFYLLFFSGFVFWSFPFPFFWDNILLSSQIAHHYYTTSFQSLLLPDNIDAGHPPFFGMYLATGWLVLGKKLWVGHLFMLPFVLGVVWQAHRLVKHFIPEKYHFLAMGLVLLDPTWLAQATQVSGDVVMLFACLLGMASLVKNQKAGFAVALALLSIVSIRGLAYMAELGFMLIFWQYFKGEKNKIFSWTWTFFPGLLLAGFYFTYHFLMKGWLRVHPDSNWVTLVETPGVEHFVHSLLIAVWRILDFGRVGLWLLFMALLGHRLLGKEPVFVSPMIFVVSWLFLILLIGLTPEVVGHRYLLSLYLSGALATAFLLFNNQYISHLAKNVIACCVCLFLLFGSFLPYPKHVSVGWDSTLAHIPFFKLKEQMINHLNQEKIDVSKVGASFPLDAPIRFSNLNNDDRSFPEKDLQHQRFILYSNVFNKFTDDEIAELEKDWIPLKTLEQGRVELVLFGKAVQ